MIKKVGIGIVALMLVSVAYVSVFKKPAAKPQPVTTTRRARPTTKPWDGTEARLYNLSFVRAGQVMTLDSIAYSNLENAKADATVTWETPKSASLVNQPKWMSSTHFWARSVTGLTWPSVASVRDLGTRFRLTLHFAGLPTLQLAQSEVGMIVKSPDGLFSVGLNPPDAPPGHTIGEKVAQLDRMIASDRTKPVVRFAGKRVARKRVHLVFRASDNLRLQRMVVVVDGQRHLVTGKGRGASFAVIFHRGRHLVKAQARDANGNLSAVAVARVRVKK